MGGSGGRNTVKNAEAKKFEPVTIMHTDDVIPNSLASAQKNHDGKMFL